jgi:phosphoribosylglycinamide formyltransferase-1
MKPHRIVIFASGSGSNAEEIIRYFEYHPSIEIKLMLSNNADAQALQRAEKYKIKTRLFRRVQFQ